MASQGLTSEQLDEHINTDTFASALNIASLHKSFGNVPILKNLNLSVPSGHVYGFLGRNGAGKSTTIRTIMGITQPDKGKVYVFGQDVSRSLLCRQQIGYVAQEQNFYGWMTAKRLGEFVAGFYPNWDAKTFQQLLGRLDVPFKQKVGTFSTGMKAKLALALAVSHHPRMLLLDEPTAGMDPFARREFIEIIRDEKITGGRTTIFSSHFINEVEMVASRVGVIESGQMYFDGSLAELHEAVLCFVSPMCSGIEDQVALTFSDVEILKQYQRDNDYYVFVRAPELQSLDLPASTWKPQKLSLEDILFAMNGKSAL
ncbi:MAG: hypothetical protein COA42_17450 [Alteromonadaceae bacterium]|nr:MAG: hypothetical protein COA42_17450 [Alteromonadaceae bacterium]